MNKHFDKLFIIFLIILIAVLFGYALRVHHDAKIQGSYQSQAEEDLTALEEEFYSALDRPHIFHIFKGQFEIYPVKESKRRFHYRRVRNNSQPQYYSEE